MYICTCIVPTNFRILWTSGDPYVVHKIQVKNSNIMYLKSSDGKIRLINIGELFLLGQANSWICFYQVKKFKGDTLFSLPWYKIFYKIKDSRNSGFKILLTLIFSFVGKPWTKIHFILVFYNQICYLLFLLEWHCQLHYCFLS